MKKNIEEHTIEIYFDSGFKAEVKYKIDEDVNDYIQEEIINSWKNESFLWLNMTYADCQIEICGNEIDQLDMRKVIALKYN